jgi:hypothetical protein
VEQLGAGSGTEGVQALLQPVFEFIWTHAWRLARRTQQGTDRLEPEAEHEKD